MVLCCDAARRILQITDFLTQCPAMLRAELSDAPNGGGRICVYDYNGKLRVTIADDHEGLTRSLFYDAEQSLLSFMCATDHLIDSLLADSRVYVYLRLTPINE